MCTDGTKSSHMKKCSELPGRAFTISRLPRGATVMKRSPHCLHPTWTAVTSIISFTEKSKFLTMVPNCAMWNTKKENTVCTYLDLFGHETFLQNQYSMEHRLRNTVLGTPNSNCVTHSSGLNSENLTRAVVLHQADKRHHNLPVLHPQVQPQLTVHQVWQ